MSLPANLRPAWLMTLTGGRSLYLRLLLAFAFLSLLPLLGLAGMTLSRMRKVEALAESTSGFVEKRAARIARKVRTLLREAEDDLRELTRLPRSDQSYATFVKHHRRKVWLRTGTNDAPGDERVSLPLYKEVSFIDPQGREQVLVVMGQPVPPEEHRDVSDPASTTYRSETYFRDAQALPPDEISVSHLTGFHTNKIDQLGWERLLARLPRATTDHPTSSEGTVSIYRYLLYELLREAGAVEFVNSFDEDGQAIRVYRVPGALSRVLVAEPTGVSPQELNARELELIDLLQQVAPEDVVEGQRYDGVIRFSAGVLGEGGAPAGVVSLALDAVHLMDLVAHVRAMEEEATVFAGTRDGDYSLLFDDQGWVIAHPLLAWVRGVDRRGQPLPSYSAKTTPVELQVGRAPLNLLELDWKLGEGFHRVVLETRAGNTGILTGLGLEGKMSTRVYSPIFYDTGAYKQHGIFGGVLMGTRADKFVEILRNMNEKMGVQTAQIRLWVLASLLGFVFLGVLLSWWLARRWVAPIRSLREAAQRIGEGALTTPIPEIGTDELGQLGGAMRQMTAALQSKIDELSEKNLKLREAQGKLLDGERVKQRRLQAELAALQEEVTQSSFRGMISESPAMQRIREEILRVAKSQATVLLLGENGTGKELVAEAIHRNSTRRERSFVRVNCAAFHENLLESELFGHMRGAYTGASSNRKGVFELADGGTLLLDEIGDMSLEMQKKLLRTLQEGEVQPLGGEKVIRVDVRLIAATNRDLGKLIREGAFREDLFHRIHVIHIRIPPLRERKEDIPPLVQHFIRKVCEREEVGEPPVLDPEAERTLLSYRWPGNVRELENAIERAVIRCRDGVLHSEDFQLGAEGSPMLPEVIAQLDKALSLEEVEKAYILGALERNRGNKKLTAEQLGIGANTLWRKLKQYNRESL